MQSILRVIVFFSCVYMGSSAFAQDSLSGKDKKAEKRVEYIRYKYISGEYHEAIAGGKKLDGIFKKKSASWTYPVQSKILQASAYYSSFKFDKAKDACKDAIQLTENEKEQDVKFMAYLLVSDYFQQTEDMVSSLLYLGKAKDLLENNNTQKNRCDLNLIQAKVFIKQGFLNEATTLIEEQLPYRLEMASTQHVEDDNKIVANKKNDFIKRKEAYASLKNLKAECLITKGSLSEAELVLANNKSWISSNLSNNHILQREVLEKMATINFLKSNYSTASSLYTDAYLATTFSEYEEYKIKNISQAIVASIYASETVKYKNYLRRLEMHAFRSVGGGDLFQLAFEYTESYKSYIEGDYTRADERLVRLASDYKFLPPSHLWNVDVLKLKAAIALKRGDIESYKKAIVSLSDIKQKYYGEGSPSSSKLLLELAIFEIRYGKDFVTAEKIMSSGYSSVLKKGLSRESKDNIYYLSVYAELFAKTDRYDSAVTKATEAQRISKIIFKENSPEYLLAYARLCEYQILAGNYKEGFSNLQVVSDLSAGVKEGDPEILQNAYMVLAQLYSLRGEFDKSQSILNKAYKLTLKGYEKQVLADAEASEQLASLYLLTGNYFKAEKLFLKSLEVKESKLSKDSPLLIHIYQELARLNLLNGNYTVSEYNLKKATDISHEVFGVKSLKYSECLLIYADYYMSIGDYKKAEDVCKMADEIQIKRIGKDNLKRSEILLKLALIRSKINTYKFADIEKLYTEAATIIIKSLGTNTPLYATLIQKQAEFYIATDKTDKADQLLNEAQKFWVSKLGSDNQYVAEIELLRGSIAYFRSKYDVAEKNYAKSRTMYARLFDENHPWYIQASGKLARVFYMQKHPEKSLTIMEEIIPKYLTYIEKYFPSLSFREKSKFWNNIKEEFEFYNFIALHEYGAKKPKLAAGVYDNIISTKALLLNSTIKIRERILSSKDSILIEMYNEWVSQKEYLTTILSLTKQQLQEQNLDLKTIEGHIERLEKDMSNRSELFNDEKNSTKATWRDIKNVLTENEYAVEIVRSRYFNKVFTDSIIYTALIIGSKMDDYPEMVVMGNGKLLEKKFFKVFRNSAIMKVKDNSSYSNYWQPIASKIPVGSTIYLSSDGVFNQLNVEMMVNAEGEYALDRNVIVPVTNTKDLLRKSSSPKLVVEKRKSTKDVKKEKETPANYVLCGNPGFYTGSVKVNEKSVPDLPGAEQEVIELNKLLVTSGKATVQFLKEDVTEDTLKHLKNPRVFHIATHGFFKEGVSSVDGDIASNPLLNSGLILSGGGDIVNHPENTYVNMKGGILTAYEAMNLNFDNTELVVLSACETGRGEVQAGEGVYGLQRAFLIAGADAVIMSLFKVNDEVTQKLMMHFYVNWLKTGDKRKSFIEAKKAIKSEYDSPIYWGAFIMIEGNPQANATANTVIK